LESAIMLVHKKNVWFANEYTLDDSGI